MRAWWAALSAASVLNLALWALSARALERTAGERRAEEQAWWRRQQLLAFGFALGCAFRSILPRADVQRLCLLDSWLSTVIVGRAVATIAELCFMAQMSRHLRRLGERLGSRAAVALSRPIVPLIALAETCSWYAVLTTNYLGSTIEESIWTLSAAMLLAGCVALRPRADAELRRLLLLPLVAAPLYLLFMLGVDVPMYFARWRADETAGRAYLPLAQGLADAASRCRVSFRWEDWRPEMPWMTLYFTLSVWLSLALAWPSSRRRA